MKKFILTALLFIGMGTMSFAQTNGQKRQHKTPEERAQHVTDMLEKKLSLTADQKSQIYAINLEGIKNFKTKGNDGKRFDRTAMKATMKDRDDKINKVLNDSQRAAYTELKAKKAEAMKDRLKKRKYIKSDKA